LRKHVQSPKNEAETRPILLVEDDPAARDMLRRTLEDQNWTVVEAEDGQAALEALKHHTPALILLDLMMPRMDGFSLTRELQRDPVWRQIPVIVLTAKLITADDRARLNGAVQNILSKSALSLPELVSELRRTMTLLSVSPREESVSSRSQPAVVP